MLTCCCTPPWQVYGDRELLDHELVRSLAAAPREPDSSGHTYLHLFVRCSDVVSLRANGTRQASVDIGMLPAAKALPRSALSDSLAEQATRSAKF